MGGCRWLAGLRQKARAHCYASLERLEGMGHLLRRPESAYLEDGVYELRFRVEGVNYRILYFFHQQAAIVVSQGFAKQAARVPEQELRVVRRRRRQFIANPDVHSSTEG